MCIRDSAYPRHGDPASNKWLTIQNRTDDTFQVQVLDSAPSTNTSAHTFKRAKKHSVKRGSIRAGGSFTHTFQSFANNGLKAKRDRAYDHAIEIKEVGHAKYTATGAAYNAATGILTLTVANNPFSNGEHVRIADNSLVMTCDMDNNATNHSYPRVTDPASHKWLEVSNVSGNNFDVNVGTTPRANYLVSAATYEPTTGDMVLTIGSHNFKGGGSTTITDAAYNPTTGILTATVPAHGMVIGDRVKFDDGSITFNCSASTGTHAFVSGVNNAINDGSSTYTAAIGTTYNPTTGVMTLEIGSHSLTTVSYTHLTLPTKA